MSACWKSLFQDLLDSNLSRISSTETLRALLNHDPSQGSRMKLRPVRTCRVHQPILAVVLAATFTLVSTSPLLSQARIVELPAIQQRTVQVGSLLEIALPDNWRVVNDPAGNYLFAPENGFVQHADKTLEFTHGLEVTLISATSGDLTANSDAIVQSLARANPRMQQRAGYTRDVVAGQAAVTALLSNVDTSTGQTETITITTFQLGDRRVVCFIGVSPERDAGLYADVFRRMRQSVRFMAAAAATAAPVPAPPT